MNTVHFISQDTTTAIDASEANDTWILKESVYMAVTGNAFTDSIWMTGKTFRIDGHLMASGSAFQIGNGTNFGGNSLVEIGKSGSVTAGFYGIVLKGGESTVSNHGSVYADNHAIWMDGFWNHVSNDGIIISENGFGVDILGDLSTIENSGTISGHTGIYSYGYTSVTNSGSVICTATQPFPTDAAVSFGWGGELTNTGLINGGFGLAFLGYEGADIINNYGIINGNIEFGGGNDVFNNLGGKVNGKVEMGDGDDIFLTSNGEFGAFGELELQGNWGTGSNNTGVFGGAGNDIYYVGNSKLHLYELFDSGNDIVYSSSSWSLGANFETLILTGLEDLRGRGNGLANSIWGNAGDNRLIGRGGNDFLQGQDGADIIRGGKGVDTAAYSESEEAVIINLKNGSGSGGDADGDRLFGIENVYGSFGDDKLIGDNGNNLLLGDMGSDILKGGKGKDIFYFDFSADIDNNNFDVILDFAKGQDKIQLTFGQTFADIEGLMTQSGSDVVITLTAIDQLTVKNMTIDLFDNSDFIFDWAI